MSERKGEIESITSCKKFKLILKSWGRRHRRRRHQAVAAERRGRPRVSHRTFAWTIQRFILDLAVEKKTIRAAATTTTI